MEDVMNISYTTKKVSLHENFKDLAEKKINRMSRMFSEDASARVLVKLERNRQTVEITIKDNSMIFRSEHTCKEMNEALDEVIESLSRQIRKNKTRLSKQLRSQALNDFVADEVPAEASEDDYSVVRTKRFFVKPLTVEEAILQMNLLEHSFFVFKNSDADDELNIVYKRNDGAYGLLEPEN